jgi:hypothetical protein
MAMVCSPKAWCDAIAGSAASGRRIGWYLRYSRDRSGSVARITRVSTPSA